MIEGDLVWNTPASSPLGGNNSEEYSSLSSKIPQWNWAPVALSGNLLDSTQFPASFSPLISLPLDWHFWDRSCMWWYSALCKCKFSLSSDLSFNESFQTSVLDVCVLRLTSPPTVSPPFSLLVSGRNYKVGPVHTPESIPIPYLKSSWLQSPLPVEPTSSSFLSLSIIIQEVFSQSTLSPYTAAYLTLAYLMFDRSPSFPLVMMMSFFVPLGLGMFPNTYYYYSLFLPKGIWVTLSLRFLQERRTAPNINPWETVVWNSRERLGCRQRHTWNHGTKEQAHGKRRSPHSTPYTGEMLSK